MHERARRELLEAFETTDAVGLRQVSTLIQVDGNAQTVDAWDPGTAGLVVTKVVDPSTSGWAITHTPSGLRTSPHFESRADAVRWARVLASLADWDRPPEQVAADGRCQELVEALTALGG